MYHRTRRYRRRNRTEENFLWVMFYLFWGMFLVAAFVAISIRF